MSQLPKAITSSHDNYRTSRHRATTTSESHINKMHWPLKVVKYGHDDLRKSQLETKTTSHLVCKFCVMKAWKALTPILPVGGKDMQDRRNQFGRPCIFSPPIGRGADRWGNVTEGASIGFQSR